MDFPSSLNDLKPNEWIRRESVTSSAAGSGNHSELSPPPMVSRSFSSTPMEIELRDKKLGDSYGGDTNNQSSTCNGFHSEKTVKNSTQGEVTSKMSSSTSHSGQFANINVNIEWDVLDSFTEFATFLENQNPICPADVLDTPEKLMSVLVWKHFRSQ